MKSISPFGDSFEYKLNEKEEVSKINEFVDNSRKNVIIQGLGFVGAAMVAAVASAKDSKGNCMYNVIGIDMPDENNYWKIGLTNSNIPPVQSTDKNLVDAYRIAGINGNLMATFSDHAYSVADIVVIDIHLDIKKKALGVVYDYDFTYNTYEKAINTIASKVNEETLILVETTVPPGTTEKVIFPLFNRFFKKRGLDISKLYIAHSYERVMPGPNYYDSIVNFYRVFSGINEKSRIRARLFLESFINTEKYPLTELHSTNASEMSKVLENSYRAINIAFIEEWTRFADSANVDLFEVIKAIRVRSTHKNIMQPGFGVGGYCLTKDSLLADWAYSNHFNNEGHMEMSLNAISINDVMPSYTFELLNKKIGNLSNKKVSILGVSYLNDVSDTRYTPTEYFYNLCKKDNALVKVHDPIVSYWKEKDMNVETKLNEFIGRDAKIVIFTVKHSEYLLLNSKEILSLFSCLEVVVDANNVISDSIAKELSNKGIKMIGVGKGHWNKYNKYNK